jgi:hypothetical protein
MELTNDNILEIWEMFCENLQASRRNDLALRFISYLIDNDHELDALEELRGQDEHLDYAFDQLGLDQTDEEYDEDSEEYSDYED